MSTLLLAAASAFFFQRTLVRTGSSERNATLGTLAVVISPMYLMLSVTFMTDMPGVFALTLCLYGCVRALQAATDRSTIAWICFAVVTCAVFGTSRQIAWLGNLVMVPSILWLLRRRRRVFLVGAATTAVAFLFVLACSHWLRTQPYSVPVPLIVRPFPVKTAIRQLSYIVLEIPFLLLPVIAVFIPQMFRSRPRYLKFLLPTALIAYVLVAFHWRDAPNPLLHLEPTAGALGNWITPGGVYTSLPGLTPLLPTNALVILTIVCLGGLLGVIAVIVSPREPKMSAVLAAELSWKQLGILLVPFTIVYMIFLVAAVGTTHVIYDRYGINLLGPATIVLIRLYQERVRPELPLATALLVAIVGVFGIIVTHNTFALDRAKVELANELHANGVPFTAIDGGWDYNFDTELQNSDHINNPLIKVPADAYVVVPPAPPGYCPVFWNQLTPHVHATYSMSVFPDKCYGRAPFAPVQYRSWPLRVPVNIYAVRYAPPVG